MRRSTWLVVEFGSRRHLLVLVLLPYRSSFGSDQLGNSNAVCPTPTSVIGAFPRGERTLTAHREHPLILLDKVRARKAESTGPIMLSIFLEYRCYIWVRGLKDGGPRLGCITQKTVREILLELQKLQNS